MQHAGTTREVAIVQSRILSKVVIPDVDFAEKYVNCSSLLGSIVEEVVIHYQNLTRVLQVDCCTS